MHDQTTEQWQACLDRWHAGDGEARDRLLAAATERLRHLAGKMLDEDFRRLRRWEDSGDVVQNVLLRLRRSLDELRPRSPREFFRAAAMQMRRELLDLARHHFGPEGGARRHHSDNPDEAATRDFVAGSSQEPGRLASWSEFHRHIADLPDEDRETFDLLWYQGLTQEEAAALLGVSGRTVKRRWQTARLRLHRSLRGEGPS